MNREAKLLKAVLKKNGYFVTRPRLRLFSILQNHNAMTVHELVDNLPSQDQATVYRNVNVFEKLGIINRVRLGWNSKLELSDIFHHHHHHLTCIKCGRVLILPKNTGLEKQISSLSVHRNFKAIDHQLEIRGICRNCQ